MKSHSLLGMRLDYVTPVEGISTVSQYAEQGHGGYCCVPNVHMCIETLDDDGFRDVVNNSSLTWSDSTILQKARAIRYSAKLTPAIKGADMMLQLLTVAREKDISIGLLRL